MPGVASFSGRAGHGPMDFDAVVLAGGLSKQLYPLVSKVSARGQGHAHRTCLHGLGAGAPVWW